MDPSKPTGPEDLATVTHARIRARQGDVDGARRVLEAILTERPDHPGALDLLGELDRLVHRAAVPAAEPELAPRARATASDLAPAFREALGAGVSEAPDPRAIRLRRWLGRIEDRRDRDAR